MHAITVRTTALVLFAGALVMACGRSQPAAPDVAVATTPATSAATNATAPTTAPTNAVSPDTTEAAAPMPTRTGPPETRVENVSDSYHGATVIDGYRWLEDGADDAVRAWSDAQNVHARRVLDALAGRAHVEARVRAILGAKTVAWEAVQRRGGATFALKRQPPRQQPFIVTFPGTQVAKARVLVDPAALDPDGGTAIDWFEASPDGALLAVSLSRGGTESGDLHIYDVATGKPIHEVVPGVNGGTAGGNMAWRPDGKGFWYTRYPRGDERPEANAFWVQVYFHTLGTPTADDRYELGKGLPKIAEYQLDVDRRTGRMLVTVQDGDGGEFAHFLRRADGTYRQFSTFGDKVIQAAFGPDDDLFVVSRQGAPRGMLLRVSPDTLDIAGATVVVPQTDETIVESFWRPPSVVPTKDRVYVLYQQGGPSVIRAFALNGDLAPAPSQPPVAAAGAMIPLDDDDLLFEVESFVAPPVWYRFDAATGATSATAIASEAPASFDDVKVTRDFATSADGTRVPVNLILPAGFERDGTTPLVLTGYGGYGYSLAPRLRAVIRVGLDHGVAYAVANLRGGGEYGEEWHRQGNLTKKQNVFDDFAAAAKHVIARRYTSPGKLAIWGGSNGGLLMGATMVQHPDLATAVVSFVGIYDMLRVELSANGAFNITEFGTVKDPAHFKAMHAYSPYHSVTDGAEYPPVLFLTGENDPRVDPMQSRKMTARLQAAAKASPNPDTPVLLRTSSDSGHGGDTPLDERVAQWTDVWTFLFAHLDVTPLPPAAVPTPPDVGDTP